MTDSPSSCSVAESPPPAKRIIIVGAGVAGLSAGYELAKAGHQILLLERSEFVGGNVRSVKLSDCNTSVDFGAMKLYQWCYNCLSIIDELKLNTTLLPVKDTLIYAWKDPCNSNIPGIQWVTDLINQGKPKLSCEPTYHKLDLANFLSNPTEAMQLIRKLVDIGCFTDNKDLKFYTPNSEKFKNQSVAAYFQDTPRILELLRIFTEGYACPTLEEIPMSVLAPLFTRAGTEYSFYGQTRTFIDGMFNSIIAANPINQILTKSIVMNVNKQDKTVTFRPTTSSSPVTVDYDEIIVTAPLGSIQVSGDSLAVRTDPVELNSMIPEFRYTKYAAVCISVNAIPSQNETGQAWTNCFEIPDEKQQFQIMSFVNLQSTLSISNHILLYIVSRGSGNLEHYLESRNINAHVTDLMQKVPLFKSSTTQLNSCIHTEIFTHRMPAINNAAINYLKNMQGDENIWYAGQYLGQFPCMESSCQSGRAAAFKIISKIDDSNCIAAEFERWNNSLDNQQIDNFKNTIYQHIMLVTGGAMAVCMLGGVGSDILSKLSNSNTPPATSTNTPTSNSNGSGKIHIGTGTGSGKTHTGTGTGSGKTHTTNSSTGSGKIHQSTKTHTTTNKTPNNCNQPNQACLLTAVPRFVNRLQVKQSMNPEVLFQEQQKYRACRRQ